MNHALLITAYKEFDDLFEMVQVFDASFNIYIHVDKKSKIDQKTLQRFKELKTVQWIGSEYKVNYGGRNHLISYLSLCEKALANKDNKLFHLITGQDFPCKTMDHFNDLLSRHEEINYLEWFDLPAEHLNEGGFYRFMYYYFCDWLDKNKTPKLISRIIKLQKIIRFKRSLPKSFEKLYGGSTYWSLNRETISYVISYTRKYPSFLNRLKHTFCSEEMYFQTVIMNSTFSETIRNTSARYIDWERKVGASPAYLFEDSFEAIIHSDALFARKFGPSSHGLKQSIKDYLKL